MAGSYPQSQLVMGIDVERRDTRPGHVARAVGGGISILSRMLAPVAC